MKTAAEFDYIIAGAGVAGLRAAIELAASGRVLCLAKRELSESNTQYAQGGIAAALSDEDEIQLHFQDTINAGDGLVNPDAAHVLVEEGPVRIEELIKWGTEFDRQGTKLAFTREGAHSRNRVLHAHGDSTGREIGRALYARASTIKNITFREFGFTSELLVENGRVCGVSLLEESGEHREIRARGVLLATGGLGQVYSDTTNPTVATGDGVAMAWRAGAEISDMEFVQFHPTCLYHPKAKSFLISEAVRGEGGILKNLDGMEFMNDAHPMKSLAPRDIVARAIDSEMKKTGADHVLLDITHQPAKFIIERFPNIYQTCLRYGIDITKEPIPVVPAAHYQCGGVVTNVDGETDIAGLYAVGEAACTGLHGANRLASNSLLEALVCAHRASAKALAARYPSPVTSQIPLWQSGKAHNPDELVVVSHNWDEIRRLMWDYVGIVRTNKRLERAAKRIANLQEEIREYYWNFIVTSDLLELRNIATAAELIVRCAQLRPESRGLHYNLDYPGTNPDWRQRDTVLRKS
ncbi:MAG: L-aspartate oxidase [Terriglobia bacterium]|nr:L-aspartate oxidase [Terriglobia bacterium]